MVKRSIDDFVRFSNDHGWSFFIDEINVTPTMIDATTVVAVEIVERDSRSGKTIM